MKEELKEILSKINEPVKKRLVLREYLQAKILKYLQEMGVFHSIAFLGGTALRFLYSLKRFSEDLDFAVINGEKPEFEKIVRKISAKFELETYDIEYKIKTIGNIKSVFFKFKGLLYELNISSHKNEIISIKVEVDYNPPEGYIVENTIIRKYFLLNLKHYELSTLFAGKLNAILTREYTKGRDIYDLFWYLTNNERVIPNFRFLNNALIQFNYSKKIGPNNWKAVLSDKIKELEWKSIINEIHPFIEDTSEISLITKENLLKLIKNY